MKTVFIETSAINWLYHEKQDADEVNQIFKTKNMIPVVGMDTIYVLSRCFMTNVPEKGIELFKFLTQLQPVYSCQRSMLYLQERDNLLTSSPVTPLLDYYSYEILIERIKQFH